MKVGLFTISSKNYLAYVRVLLESVARVHPEYKLYLCLADRIDGYFDPTKERFEIIEATQLAIPNFEAFAFRYDVIEFNTAVKPFVLKWLFSQTDLDTVIYLDPDIRVYSRFESVENALDAGASIVLTPHITRPLEDGKNPSDFHMLQAGVFNLGFIAASRSAETEEFISWWGRRLERDCVVNIKGGLFVDQKWCDLAPCFVEHLHVLRHPGYNVAYWNLMHRRLVRDERGIWLADSRPLAFFHFSGVDPLNSNLLSKHQDRFQLDQLPSVKLVINEYISELKAANWEGTRKWPYAFGQFNDGTPINHLYRLVYRSHQQPSQDTSVSPFRCGAAEICNHPASYVGQSDGLCITELMHLVYTLRPDVSATFSLNATDGREGFARWFEMSGKSEYYLPDEVTQQSKIVPGTSSKDKDKQRPILILLYKLLLSLRLIAARHRTLFPKAVWTRLRRAWIVLHDRVLSQLK